MLASQRPGESPENNQTPRSGRRWPTACPAALVAVVGYGRRGKVMTMEESDRTLISQSQTDEVSKCTLTRLPEAAYANAHARKGVVVYEHRNRYWRNSEQLGSLLAVPIHWMAELTPDQATFPKGRTLAIKARTTHPAEHNGSFHLYLIDPTTYSLRSMNKGARKNIRRACRAGVTVELATPELLEREGYEVTSASLKMSRYRKPPSKADYLRKLHNDTFFGGQGVVLAGLVPRLSRSRTPTISIPPHGRGKATSGRDWCTASWRCASGRTVSTPSSTDACRTILTWRLSRAGWVSPRRPCRRRSRYARGYGRRLTSRNR